MNNTNDEQAPYSEKREPMLSYAVMGSAFRLPEGFLEYDGEDLMSNFDGQIIQETAEAIKGNELFSTYAGWDFNGKVWWMDGKWLCEVWCYGSWKETVIKDTLQEIMDEVCSKYGSD